MEAVAYPHLALSADGVPHIAGQRTRVIDIVLDQIIHAWDAHQIQKQHPHLTLAQIHSALAYYHDHKEAMDQAIADRWRREEFLVAQLDCMPAQMRLRALKGGQ